MTDDEIILKHELMTQGYISDLKEDTSNITFDYNLLCDFVSERLKAYIFISGADKKRFKDLHNNLRDSMALQQNIYPITLSDAMSVLQKFDLNNPAESKSKDPSSQQHKNKQTDKRDQEHRKRNGERTEKETKEGVSLFQEDDANANEESDGSNAVPESEIQLLQQILEEDDDNEEEIHFMSTQLEITTAIIKNKPARTQSSRRAHVKIRLETCQGSERCIFTPSPLPMYSHFPR